MIPAPPYVAAEGGSVGMNNRARSLIQQQPAAALWVQAKQWPLVVPQNAALEEEPLLPHINAGQLCEGLLDLEHSVGHLEGMAAAKLLAAATVNGDGHTC
mmetsp:Transcript_74294/g.168293  ORF Transcript_74294/g.168293 Transcript_74294/m.168293 type:complete len:100 (-) Transcript_74294:11-310(-)